MKTPSANLLKIFSEVPDPRSNQGKRHLIEELLTITVLAVICGADDWSGIEAYGQSQEGFLKTFLKLEFGIPSDDTFRRLFIRLDSEAFESTFLNWTKELASITGLKRISIDGKTSRRSHIDQKNPLHLVSAWANDYRLTMVQVRCEDKSNEITAIPKLLDLLCLEGAIVSIDAMGTQKSIAQKIIDQKADYILALKENHHALYEESVDLFRVVPAQEDTWVDKGHGRIETRKCQVIYSVDMLDEFDKWPGFRSLIKIESTRQVGEKITTQTRYYISSLRNTAQEFNRAIRNHWGIENELHWVLDMVFREDECRKRTGNEAENFSIIRRFVLNLLKKDPNRRLGLKNKRLKAAWNHEYLLTMVSYCRQ